MAFYHEDLFLTVYRLSQGISHKSIINERFIFYNAQQHENELTSSYISGSCIIKRSRSPKLSKRSPWLWICGRDIDQLHQDINQTKQDIVQT